MVREIKKKKTLAESDKMDQQVIRSKHKILDEFWTERGLEKHRPTIRRGGPCDWCEKFRPLNFRVCMNCGADLGGEGFFDG